MRRPVSADHPKVRRIPPPDAAKRAFVAALACASLLATIAVLENGSRSFGDLPLKTIVAGLGAAATAYGLYAFAKRLRRRYENLFVLARGLSAATSDEFFRKLVERLASVLRADFVLVAELIPNHPGKIRTIAIIGDGEI